jgi:hypothetical protein
MPSPAACRGRLHFFTPARTEAKENKYSLGKSVSDGRYSFVGMRSLFGEALCTKLVILQPHRDDRKNGRVSFVTCHSERAAVCSFFRQMLPRVRTLSPRLKKINIHSVNLLPMDDTLLRRNEISLRRSTLHKIGHPAASSR